MRFSNAHLFTGESRAGFYFGDLLVVTHIVERDIDQPLVCVERAEDGEGVIGGVLFQSYFGFLREFDLSSAPLFVAL